MTVANILYKTKTLRNGILGPITVSAAQTKALLLPSPNSPTHSVTTIATLNLRFYPNADSSEPSNLGSVMAKIKASTFFSIVSTKILPNPSCQRNIFDGHWGAYRTSMPLSLYAWNQLNGQDMSQRPQINDP